MLFFAILLDVGSAFAQAASPDAQIAQAGFTKNRARVLNADLAQHWLQAVVVEVHQARLLDEDHFSVDGTLIQAWAGERSSRPKSDPPARGSGRGGKLLKRDVMESSTDPDARLYQERARLVPAE